MTITKATGDSGWRLTLVGTALALTLFTLVTLVLPAVHFAVRAPGIDLLVNHTAALISAVAAWLAWLRYRVSGDWPALFQASAFVVLAASNLIQVAAGVGIGASALHMTLEDPGQAPVYIWSLARVLAGFLLLYAALRQLRPAPTRLPAAAILLGPVVLFALSSIIFVAVEPNLPQLLEPEAFAHLLNPDDVGVLPGISPLELTIHAVGVTALLAGSIAYARAAKRRGIESLWLLALALLIAAFSELHFALYPGIYVGLVTTSDLLRVAFYGCVIFAVEAESASSLRSLRVANVELAELREAELERAAMEERTQLAREVHDGVAQNIWLAKLALEELNNASSPADAKRANAQLENLLDAGMEEAQQTILALRAAARPATPFHEVLSRYAARFAEQTGLSMDVDIDALADQQLPSTRVGAELLRIAQEALNNIRKHADATMVRVAVRATAEHIELEVRDNGIGFDTKHVNSGYGLETMRERAALVGGTLRVVSQPSGGTMISVELPTAG